MSHPTLFISDLHLTSERERANEQFFRLVGGPAMSAQALYILGDLFEYWLGDDDDAPLHREVARALRGLHARGTLVYFMHGNRDLLLGAAYAAEAGVTLIHDPYRIDLDGVPTLLMHGDTLCTDDIAYQRFRAQARDPSFQARFLAQPVAERRQQILGLRAQSEHEKSKKSLEIMDVADDEVARVLREHGYPRLIHGHTHRPARHEIHLDGHTCERWVLGDWYGSASYLACDADGCRVERLD